MRVKRALLSVSNKEGIVEFAKGLKELDVELIATGGTGRLLQETGLPCTPIEQITGFPEILSGRVKTLHPAVIGGILARRDVDLDEIAALRIDPIDLVAVNLYPFEEVAFSEVRDKGEVLKEIDIGGCSLLRSAAKNYPDVAVVSSPERYGDLIDRLRESGGELDEIYLKELAREAFHHTAVYDALIARYFDESIGTETNLQSVPHFHLIGKRSRHLRYGENPHQSASFFRDPVPGTLSIASAIQLHGKELSYNNIMDLDSAVSLVVELPDVACVIVKHTNPCGVGIGDRTLEAYRKALATDSVSAFGSIIAFNAAVDHRVAEEMKSLFVECVVAPSFSDRALEVLKAKKNLRVLELPGVLRDKLDDRGYHVRSVMGGILVQEKDNVTWDEERLTTVTTREVTLEERKALSLAWIVCKHIKSNGIVIAAEDRTIGIGTGQMSRIDSVEIALMKARNAELPTENSVMASDAFFPFRDSVDRVAREGITAVVQPGGSIRDEDVIQAANEHGMAMIFTGIRHFRH